MKVLDLKMARIKYLQSGRQAGYSIVEAMVGAGVLVLLVVSMFALLTSGFSVIRFNRENLRATQIVLNRVEGLRLYNWSQLTQSNMVPATFTEYYYPLGNNNKGTVYTGTVTVGNAVQNPPSSYSTNMMRSVTVQVAWNSGAVQHTRRTSTYVSQYGVQNYLFTN